MAFPNIPFLVTKNADVLYQDGLILHSQMARHFQVDEDAVIKAEYDFDKREMLFPSAPFDIKQTHLQAADEFIRNLIPNGDELGSWFQRNVKKVDLKMLALLSPMALKVYEAKSLEIHTDFSAQLAAAKIGPDGQELPETMAEMLAKKIETKEDEALLEAFLYVYKLKPNRVAHWR